MSSSIGGSLTGRGGDIIILDDPIKPIDALSDKKRDDVNDAFFNTILSRLNDKRTGAIVIVMQRLHEDDLVGRLTREQPEHWDQLIVPAIAEQEETIDIGKGPHVRRVGDVLHPEREPAEILESYRAQLGQTVFSAQYQQCPVPRDGAMIKRTWVRRYGRLPERNSAATVIESWDPAMKESEQADYSVCTTWLFHDGRYYLADVFRERIDYPTLKARAISLAGLHKPNKILIEDAAGGTALQHAGLPALAVKPEFDKRTRMSIQSAKFESGRVFLPNVASWLDAYETELFTFPGGRYDDQIDSTSQALAYEMPSGLFTAEGLNGYSNLIEGLMFNRYFGGR